MCWWTNSDTRKQKISGSITIADINIYACSSSYYIAHSTIFHFIWWSSLIFFCRFWDVFEIQRWDCWTSCYVWLCCTSLDLIDRLDDTVYSINSVSLNLLLSMNILYTLGGIPFLLFIFKPIQVCVHVRNKITLLSSSVSIPVLLYNCPLLAEIRIDYHSLSVISLLCLICK